MALFIRSSQNCIPIKCIKIIDSQMTDDHTEYKIEISLGVFKWTVVKRYSEFHDLHEKIIKEFPMIDKDSLPKKRIFGNQSKSFIAKRREALQVYLQSLLRSLPYPPPILIIFLAFHKYEVHGLTEGLAQELYKRGEELLASDKFSTLSTIQMYAICSRLVLSEPTCISNDVKRDMGHLVDFVNRLKHLQVIGQALTYGSSNIVPNDLPFNLQHFKALQTLKLVSCRLSNVCIDHHVKKSLRKLIVSRSLSQIKQVLMSGLSWDDCSQLSQAVVDEYSWPSIETLILRSNKIEKIDDSLRLLPSLSKLILCDNRLSDVEHLIHSSFLHHLDLSHNHFTTVHSFHTKMGNISHLNLSNNRVSSLEGFAKLYSLVDLNLSHNRISEVAQTSHLGDLPFLQTLDLRHNALTAAVDYRLLVLSNFTERFAELTLDGVKTSGKEVELVQVRQVLSSRRKSPSQQHHHHHQQASTPLQNEPSSKDPSAVKGSQRPDRKDANEKFEKSDAASTKEDAEKMVSESADALASKCKPSSSGSKPASAPQAIAYQFGHQDLLKRRLSGKKRRRYLMLPETLPNHCDKSLLATIQSLLAAVVLKGGMKDYDIKQETPCCVAWCGVVLNHSRFKETEGDLPACVCLTAHSMHLFRVEALRGDAGIPKMKHLTSLRFADVQCFLLGVRKTYVRIIVRDQPSFALVLVTFSASKTEHLLAQVKRAYRRSVPELDEYEDPLVCDVGAACEQQLLSSILPFHSPSTPSTLTFFQLVQPIREGVVPHTTCTHALVATTYNLYVIKHDFVFAPSIPDDVMPVNITTCQSNSIEVASVFPIAGKIITIQFYDVDSLEQHSSTHLDQPKLAPAGLGSSDDFIGYGLKITFNLGPSGAQTLDLRWPTSNLRDTFLTWLVGSRNGIREGSSSSETCKQSKNKKKKNEVLGAEMVGDAASEEEAGEKLMVPCKPSTSQGTASHSPPTFPHPSFTLTSSSESISPSTSIPGTPQTSIHPQASVNTSEADATNDLRTASPLPMPLPTNEDTLEDNKSFSLDDHMEGSFNGFYNNFQEEQVAVLDLLPEVSGMPEVSEQCIQVENFKMCLSTHVHTIRLEEASSETKAQRDPTHKHISEEYLSSPSNSFVLFPSLRDLSTDLNKLDLFLERHVVSREGEVLKHLTIACVSFYEKPLTHLPACIFLTNHSIHIFSNFDVSQTDLSYVYCSTRPHCICLASAADHLDVSLSLNNFNNPLLRRLAKVDLQELYEVDIGMFAQFIRFVVHDQPSRIVCCLTRDATATQALMRQLLKCLSTVHPSKAPTDGTDSDDCSVYERGLLSQGTSEEFVYNFVKFFYPSHELLADLSFVVSSNTTNFEQTQEEKNFKKLKFIAYLSCFVLKLSKKHRINSAYVPLHGQSLVLTKEQVTFVSEDSTTFPLPDFVVFPPQHGPFEFRRSYSVSCLRQIVRYEEDSRILKMTFEKANEDGGKEEDEEKEDEIEVDISFKHFDGEVRPPMEMEKVARVLVHVTNSADVDSLVASLLQLQPSACLQSVPLLDF